MKTKFEKQVLKELCRTSDMLLMLVAIQAVMLILLLVVTLQ